MLFLIAVVTLCTGLIVVDAEADAASYLNLAEQFSPILILTEKTGGKSS